MTAHMALRRVKAWLADPADYHRVPRADLRALVALAERAAEAERRIAEAYDSISRIDPRRRWQMGSFNERRLGEAEETLAPPRTGKADLATLLNKYTPRTGKRAKR